MRHQKKGRKLNRTSAHRKATFNNLVRALVTYEMIETTEPKAKELRRFSDRLITMGKKDTLHSRRQAFKVLKDRELVGKLFDVLAKRDEIAQRQGGYTRIWKLGNRRGDNAPLALVSWVGSNYENTEKLRYDESVLAGTQQQEVNYQVQYNSSEEE